MTFTTLASSHMTPMGFFKRPGQQKRTPKEQLRPIPVPIPVKKDTITISRPAQRLEVSKELRQINLPEAAPVINLDEAGVSKLWLATYKNKSEEIARLIQEGANPNEALAGMKNESGFSPIHLAVRYGNPNTFKALLKAPDVDLNEVDPDHRTPLILSARYARLDLMKKLIEQNVKLNEVDRFGKSALSYVTNNADATRMLKNAGATR